MQLFYLNYQLTMNLLLKKLNFKSQRSIFIINAPDDLHKMILEFSDYAEIKKQVKHNDAVEFAMLFAIKQEDINNHIKAIAPLLKDDAILWVCYPKGSSKKYKCDFNRDTGWEIMGNYDLEGVRQVAIDEDWSALRFRKVDYIKTLTRKFDALSERGKIKANQTKD